MTINHRRAALTQIPALPSSLHSDESPALGEGWKQNQLPAKVWLVPWISWGGGGVAAVTGTSSARPQAQALYHNVTVVTGWFLGTELLKVCPTSFTLQIFPRAPGSLRFGPVSSGSLSDLELNTLIHARHTRASFSATFLGKQNRRGQNSRVTNQGLN